MVRIAHMYPERDIPVFQISVDAYSPEAHYKIGRELKSLREEGVLIFGTGNIVHNLRLVDWHMESKGFDWHMNLDEYIYENIFNRNYNSILKYNEMCSAAKYEYQPRIISILCYMPLELLIKKTRLVYSINPVNWSINNDKLSLGIKRY